MEKVTEGAKTAGDDIKAAATGLADAVTHPKATAHEVGEVLKEAAVASAGVSPYGGMVDGTVEIKPVTDAVMAVDEVADAGRGVNAYGTNVDNKMGGKLEK
mmetsp:Transcript_10620/g.22485  ORF Transcript_10620/g.22485 Transcript_10620/m.22485 type:complete len:101 (-) Transcript_10620:233-535(-)|eukprot:CAMPEP_0178515552 /NCGR_PEP_ID=MMETSP0696-20121128/24617_1 /TAXON_ID=265572 /ORGANISM="Extubocellulus spinifer, Strain CCMP396" /LENGTH=100 /DNA_ID=CAMNT_0020145721 /DNA_START=35 /DNA_END=337 /DNA_ORIENTATION=-